ncbi:hypothetical protein PHMEG_00020272 [Phytophthora megakarya]|uniref:Uncharacterized protein n=1 Tax=Phytophthora megakarya TaxID=4795 RepID=A0A225VPS0_9STRA|nr:hypothetical protein PHMEG_00020272 [Phytophthora megakarya]
MLLVVELFVNAPLSYRDRLLEPDFCVHIVAMPDRKAKAQFRFIVTDLQRLEVYLQLSDRIITKEGALRVRLRRVIYPQRWVDMAGQKRFPICCSRFKFFQCIKLFVLKSSAVFLVLHLEINEGV